MLYSDVVMDQFRNPRNAGRLEPCSLVGKAGTPGHGAFMLFTVRLEDDRITDVRFQTFGCGPAIAAGSVMTELVLGRPLVDTLSITGDALARALGGLPEEKLYCVELAIKAWGYALAKVVDHGGPVGSAQ